MRIRGLRSPRKKQNTRILRMKAADRSLRGIEYGTNVVSTRACGGQRERSSGRGSSGGCSGGFCGADAYGRIAGIASIGWRGSSGWWSRDEWGVGHDEGLYRRACYELCEVDGRHTRGKTKECGDLRDRAQDNQWAGRSGGPVNASPAVGSTES